MSCESYFVNLLHQRGLRVTPQRLAVLQALHTMEDFVTAEALYARVAAEHPNLDRSTVYRTLDLLVEMQMVTVLTSGDGVMRYELVGTHGVHHHLHCVRCHQVIGIPAAELEAVWEHFRQRYGFVWLPTSLTFHGVCAACASLEQEKNPEQQPACREVYLVD